MGIKTIIICYLFASFYLKSVNAFCQDNRYDEFPLISLDSSIYNWRIKESKKIATFCKVWGFLKYHHPEVAKGKFDWDKEFMNRVSALTKLNSKQEMSDYYSKWIDSLGIVKKRNENPNEILNIIKNNLNNDWLNDTSIFSQELVKQLRHIHQNRNKGKNVFIKNKSDQLFYTEKVYKDSVFPTPSMRLLGLSRYWNIINYFYPYKYKIGQDWDSVLIEMIPLFKYSNDTISYHLAMLELVVKINDSHANLVTKYTNRYFGLKWAPFHFKIIDNKAIVTGFYDASLCLKNDIKYGDVFLKVNNVNIEEIIREKYKYIEGSNYSVKLRNSYYSIFNGQTDSVSVIFERNSITYKKTIYRYYFRDFRFKEEESNKKSWDILEDNIGYVNLDLLKRRGVKIVMNKMKSTTGIIFDVRNYPKGTMYKIAKFLNSAKRPFAKFAIPNFYYPGTFTYTNPYYCGKANRNNYKGKVVLLFNEESQSHAEFTLMALQTASNVISIGSQTAGADGDVSEIIFPGNYKTFISGLGVYYPDGRETQRIGIIPDIEVKPTIDGVRLRKDEVLEKALGILRLNPVR